MSKGNESHGGESILPFSVTLRVRDACMCLHLQRAARAVARRFDEALRPHGLTNGQFSLLMSLNRPEAPLMRDVAAFLAMDRTSLTAMLKPLERRGLLRIEPDRQDRRGRRLILLDAGRAVLAAALPDWTRTEAEIEALPGLGDAQALRDELRAVSAS